MMAGGPPRYNMMIGVAKEMMRSVTVELKHFGYGTQIHVNGGGDTNPVMLEMARWPVSKVRVQQPALRLGCF